MDNGQKVNVEIDKELWRKVGIKAAEEVTSKKVILEKALIMYLEKEKNGKP